MTHSTQASHAGTSDQQMLKNISYVGVLVAVTACVIGFVASSIG